VTQPGRDAHFQKFLDQCRGDEKQARNLWRAHFQNLARKSLAARKAKAEVRKACDHAIGGESDARQ
jgi:hypothetical protein